MFRTKRFLFFCLVTLIRVPTFSWGAEIENVSAWKSHTLDLSQGVKVRFLAPEGWKLREIHREKYPNTPEGELPLMDTVEYLLEHRNAKLYVGSGDHRKENNRPMTCPEGARIVSTKVVRLENPYHYLLSYPSGNAGVHYGSIYWEKGGDSLESLCDNVHGTLSQYVDLYANAEEGAGIRVRLETTPVASHNKRIIEVADKIVASMHVTLDAKRIQY